MITLVHIPRGTRSLDVVIRDVSFEANSRFRHVMNILSSGLTPQRKVSRVALLREEIEDASEMKKL